MSIIINKVKLKVISTNKTMKLLLNLSLLLLSIVFFGDKSFSLTDNQIKKFCKKDFREKTCIKNLRDKKSNLLKGNLIEIPVIPYKR